MEVIAIAVILVTNTGFAVNAFNFTGKAMNCRHVILILKMKKLMTGQ
jgi:hypothetical protein